jgi:DNA-binding response OmpR family regulator
MVQSKIWDVRMIIKGKSILVVDDDQSILRSTKSVLQREGYAVETAETGKKALEKMQKKRYDVVLLDVKLPDIEGTDLLLQMDNPNDTIKIIITGFSTDELGKRAADYGADDFLVKPISPEELLETIRERLATNQSKIER